MIWYSGVVDYDGNSFPIEGTFDNSIVKISTNGHILYEKSINMWSYQEIYAEDIFMKYEGMVRKSEGKIQLLVDSGIIIPQ